MMTAAPSPIHPLVPSENWDDDFEFHQHNTNAHHTKQKPSRFESNIHTSPTRTSTSSSKQTEDWDTDSPPQPLHQDSFNALRTPPQSPSRVLSDRLNTNSGTRSIPFELSTWAEPGPSTPSKKYSQNSKTENWDEDFEDTPDSPARLSLRGTATPSKKARAKVLRLHTRVQQSEEPVESWDDEFGLTSSPVRPMPQKEQSTSLSLAAPDSPPSSLSPSKARRRQRNATSDDYYSSSEDDRVLPGPLIYPNYASDDEDDEFGFAEREEEDRTVTARSRRAALSRLTDSWSSSAKTTQVNSSPPPPVPALPPPFLQNTLHIPLSLNAISTFSPSTSHPQMFPRSPTASVFSVPTITDTHSSFHNSTTHLRPTISRTSSGLGNLPPSPPIHKERERRRLRKKSRPHPQGVYELTVLRGVSEVNTNANSTSAFPSYSDAEAGVMEGAEYSASESRPQTPPQQQPHSQAIPTPSESLSNPVASAPIISSPSNSTKGAILSRIGSVKRWSVRRKRGSSVTPSEAAMDNSFNSDVGKARTDVLREEDLQLTPRPRSSLSSLHPSSDHSSFRHSSVQPPAPFFRDSSPGVPPEGLRSGWTLGNRTGSGNSGNSNSTTDLSIRERDRASTYTPSPDSVTGPKAKQQKGFGGGSVLSTPTKLLKRKSLGFVQLRRSGAPSPSPVHEESDRSGRGGAEGKRPMSVQGSPSQPVQQRHASYGGLGLGRVGRVDVASVDDLPPVGKERSNSSALSSRNKERGIVKEKDKCDNEEGDKAGGEREEKEGGRRFMGSVRRISLVPRHKRTKSGVSVAEGILPRLPSQSSPIDSRKSTDQIVANNKDNARPKTPALLPPIELQPPSPPRKQSQPRRSSEAKPSALPSSPVAASESATSMSSASTSLKTLKSPATPSSPQSASLGRSTLGSPGGSSGNGGNSNASSVLRRNSLGDLKIPARISQAQVGLRRDLGMVREFAANVELLKNIQTTYNQLVMEVQEILDTHARLHTQQQQNRVIRASSPGFFKKSKTRQRSNTNPTPSTSQLAYKELASAFYTINSKYRISWECAELLIELGSGPMNSGPTSSASAPAMQGDAGFSISSNLDTTPNRARERAITLSGGDESSKPPTPVPGATGMVHAAAAAFGTQVVSPPSLMWRASTGRHDLSQRQLVLLKEMLSNSETSPMAANDRNLSIPEEGTNTLHVNREWRWGDAASSTVTLPSEDSTPLDLGGSSPLKKRRGSRLGMSGIRDMLRSLKRTQIATVPPLPASSTSLSTESSMDSSSHQYHHPHILTQGRRKLKLSTGPESMRAVREREERSPYTPSSLSVKPSPRRPSLASIFRLGNRRTATGATSSTDTSFDRNRSHSRASGLESGSNGEEDWDRMDSASDLDAAAKALFGNDGSSTVRGKKGHSPYLQHNSKTSSSARPVTPNKRSASASRSSIWGESPTGSAIPPRSTRLSNVDEHDIGQPRRVLSKGRGSRRGPSPSRPSSSASRLPNKSGSVRSMPPQSIGGTLPDPKLAVTPENIKALLENSKEVHARLGECIAEIRALLAPR